MLPIGDRFAWLTTLNDRIWANRTFRIRSVSDSQRIESDQSVAFQEPLIWADYNHVLLKVKRISACVVQVPISDHTSDGNSSAKPVECIVGFRVEYISRKWSPERSVGILREKDEEDELLDWPEEWMRHFDINGRDGEYITEIGQAPLDEPRAVMVSLYRSVSTYPEKLTNLRSKLRTNRGRNVVFGEAGQEKWAFRRAPDGETICGLAAMFATKFGLKEEMGTHVRFPHCIAFPLSVVEADHCGDRPI
jgi:hypothetical protein